WRALLDDRGLGRIELPTYAFQRERYWLESTDGPGDLAAAGQAATEHPLLGAAVRLAGEEGWLFTGRLSLKHHPWLADHAVLDTLLLPGTGFVELALSAAAHVGAREIEDLTLVAPLLLDGERAVQLQVAVAAPDADGRRPVNVYSRAEDAPADQDWTLHASGLLGDAAGDDADLESFATASWPPEGCEAVDLDGFYDRVADAGYDYGPAFQGLREAYRTRDALYAEIALAGEAQGQAGEFGVHPALSDAALHTLLLAALERDERDVPPEVPFSFSGVRVHRGGASSLRVRVETTEESGGESRTVGLVALDESGEPVLAIDAVRVRALDRATLRAQASGTGREALYAVGWTELPSPATDGPELRAAFLGAEEEVELGVALEAAGIEVARYPDVEALAEMVAAGMPAPQVVLARTAARAAGGGLAEAVHDGAERTLELLQAWLGSEPLPDARLVLLTEAALAVSEGESPDLAQAALVGLVRSAQSENPGRLGLVDLDGTEASAGRLSAALASDEPELALRNGVLHAPRLARASVEDAAAAQAPDPGGTVLITGATGGLGPLVARHLAAEHGARRLLLT
ncbi:MAG: polyketide synthase dehydratase domain-containing protein, partial [Actinomycetota bacterium]|nr:polyketide synthase dehydratase domain-containing protein [Actinomycetota bacterium]